MRTPPAAPAVEAFELDASCGYGEEISNRVVDALGDFSGGVRLRNLPVERITDVKINRGPEAGARSELRTATFTGEV